MSSYKNWPVSRFAGTTQPFLPTFTSEDKWGRTWIANPPQSTGGTSTRHGAEEGDQWMMQQDTGPSGCSSSSPHVWWQCDDNRILKIGAAQSGPCFKSFLSRNQHWILDVSCLDCITESYWIHFQNCFIFFLVQTPVSWMSHRMKSMP